MIVEVITYATAGILAMSAFGRVMASRDARRRFQPSLLDILRASRRHYQLTHSVTLKRQIIDQRMVLGDRWRLDKFLRDYHPGEWTDWSIDYCYPHKNEFGVSFPGSWGLHRDKKDTAKVYLYKRLDPPAPPPKPKKEPQKKAEPIEVVVWSKSDELHQRLLFEQNPLAFWLAPDWERARELKEPVWMIEPDQPPVKCLDYDNPRMVAIKTLAGKINTFEYDQMLHNVYQVHSVLGRDNYVLDVDTGEKYTHAEIAAARHLSEKQREHVKRRVEGSRQYR